MLRSLVEALGNGCLTLFDGHYEGHKVDYRKNLPTNFQHCSDIHNLCITCRTFGTLQRGMVFLGKVNISDAEVVADKVYEHKPIYTKPLMTPRPHHDSFYLDQDGEHIAGRKFFFHHSDKQELLTSPGIHMMGNRPSNRYIRPLDFETQFRFRIDFTKSGKR